MHGIGRERERLSTNPRAYSMSRGRCSSDHRPGYLPQSDVRSAMAPPSTDFAATREQKRCRFNGLTFNFGGHHVSESVRQRTHRRQRAAGLCGQSASAPRVGSTDHHRQTDERRSWEYPHTRMVRRPRPSGARYNLSVRPDGPRHRRLGLRFSNAMPRRRAASSVDSRQYRF